MDIITRSLIKQLFSELSGYGDDFENEMHQIIKDLDLDISNLSIDEKAIELIKSGTGYYAYMQVMINSVIPPGIAREFLRDSIKYQESTDHYGNHLYCIRILEKNEILKQKDPVWVYKNYEDILVFMDPSWEPYLKIKQIINKINSL